MLPLLTTDPDNFAPLLLTTDPDNNFPTLSPPAIKLQSVLQWTGLLKGGFCETKSPLIQSTSTWLDLVWFPNPGSALVSRMSRGVAVSGPFVDFRVYEIYDPETR